MFCGSSTLGTGRSTGILSRVGSTSFMSGRLAPATTPPIGMPWPSVSRLRLVPALARSVGLGPVFFPAQGRFGHHAVQGLPLPFNADPLVKFQQPSPPEILEEARGAPFLEAVMDGAIGPQAAGDRKS